MPDSPQNRLSGETSPYLLQHAGNPVAWQPWDEAALTAARCDDRPILLSIGYSACHWCHVMAHESFEDPTTAVVMNRLFVNIKVDREERPDLDQIYQSAHQMLTGRPGGWPLTLFLTPDGTPFFGGTYFPDEPRYGLPGFADLCERVAGLYRERRGDIDRQNASLRDALAATLPAAGTAAPADAAPLAAARALLLGSFDRDDGGFGGAPKFPHPTDLAFLLRRAVRDGDAQAREAACFTLERMAAGGIHDQLGGGFCRYSVDERWEIPHFEKMLYDNGPLLALYAEAWRISDDDLFARTAAATAAWIMREMQAPQGGYYSSLDADSEGEEGRYYVWDREEVRGLLGQDEWRAVAGHWGLDGPPNFEGRHWHLRVAAPLAEGMEGPAARAREKLLRAREARVRPGRDEKLLTSWNALAIGGMAKAARLLGRPDWLASARRALAFLRTGLWRDGRLLATCKDGRAHLDAYLDDYAFLLAALLETMQAEFVAADLAWAQELAEALLDRFEDKVAGGFYFTAHDHERLIHRPKPGFDNATPAGNGVAATALQRLGHLLGEPRYLAAARRTLALFRPQYASRPGGCASLLEALEEELAPPTIVLLRGPGAEVAEWNRRLARRWDGLVFPLPNGTAGLPPAMAKPESNQVNAWACSGVTCSAPVADFDELSRIILIRR
ncbi:MAG: thioredoxin domain-containing protein [Sterolibacteriaceae bacterium MAG5]|nr:thioredoxin domain-containing protein [Candidatus Nitricoxidireducens bremensis]